jgi:hypothetical protein
MLVRDCKYEKWLATTVLLAVLAVVVGCQPAQDGSGPLELLQAFILDFARQVAAAFLL